MKHIIPQIRVESIPFKGKSYNIEYFVRRGSAGTILFVHGLGGAKENFWDALKSQALRNYCIISFDNPGTGNSTYYEDEPLEVDDLVEITSSFINALDLNNFFLAGASMGGLTTLHFLRKTTRKIQGYINIEGNLTLEDCMFSSKVIGHHYQYFRDHVFRDTIRQMKEHGNAGYYFVANNLEQNTNIKSYYQYSFQTVQYSATGDLLKQYLSLEIPNMFIYGDRNKGLSYIPELEKAGKQLKAILGSDHFVFYDNPKELYDSIGDFVVKHPLHTLT